MSAKKIDTAPDFMSTVESQRLAVDDFIAITAEDARANWAMGEPLTGELGRIAKTREPRRQKVDEWIKKQLAADPSLKSPELWQCAPGWIKDQIAVDAFKKRVTGVRKERR